MTYARAKLIIWNPKAYTRFEVQRAAAYVLGSIDASAEDLAQAAAVV